MRSSRGPTLPNALNLTALTAAVAASLLASVELAAAQWCGVPPHDNVCLTVRCKPNATLGLFGSGIDPGGIDPVLSLHNGDYSVVAVSKHGPAPFPIEFWMPFPAETLDGLKRSGGTWLQFGRKTVKISLEGSFAAISDLEQTCTASPNSNYSPRIVCGASAC